MKICEIQIKNYRNFKDFKINLEQFNVIIGENNVGKTNLVKLIEGILNPNLSYKRFLLKENDFIDLEKEIEVIIKFNELTDNDIYNLDETIINPDDESITLKFKSKWNEKEKEINNECYFIELNDGKEIKLSEFNYDARQNFHYYLIPCNRSVKESIKLKRKSDLDIIQRIYFPEFMISINILKKEIIDLFNNFIEILDEDNDLDYFLKIKDDISSKIKEFQNLPLQINEKIIGKYKKFYNDIKIKKEEIFNLLSKNKTDIEDNEFEIIQKAFNSICLKLEIFIKRLDINLLIENLKDNLLKIEGITNLNKEIEEIFKNIMPNTNLELSFLTVNDNELLKEVLFEMDSFSVFDQGKGFQNYFVIVLKLLKIKSILLNQNQIKSVFLAIEEPEVHLHPHLQRQLLKNLKKIQNIFYEEYNINMQIIITSHSSNIIKNIEYNELKIIRKNKESFSECIEFPKNIFEIILQEFDSNQNNDKLMKVKKSLIIIFNKIISFYPELFFSKIAILGEGQTEEGAIPIFASKLNLDFDNYGIIFINMEGEGNINYYSAILGWISMPFLIIIDKDKGGKIINQNYVRLTHRKAFEDEILNSLPLYKIYEVLVEIYGENFFKDSYSQIKNKLDNRNLPYLNDLNDLNEIIEYIKNLESNELVSLKRLFRNWLKKRKGLMLGKLLAQKCEEEEIPNVYKEIIEDAVRNINKSDSIG